jgi:hypothetical protein
MQEKYKLLCSKLKFHFPQGIAHADVLLDKVLEDFVCHIPDTRTVGVSKKKSGGKHNKAIYYQVSGYDRNSKFMGHKLAACLAYVPPILYEKMDEQGLESSHLCHNHECIKRSHLNAETRQYNRSRNSGMGCGGWIWYKKDRELYKMCEHAPPCMHLRVREKRVAKYHGSQGGGMCETGGEEEQQ